MPDDIAEADQPRRIVYEPLPDLLRMMDPRNPKGHADDDIRASIGRFGYTEPVMRDERTGRLISGHGRVENLEARREAGQDPPDGIVLAHDGRWLVPVVRGWRSRSDDEAGAYLVAVNRLTEKGGWRVDPLASILSELALAPDGLAGVGYDPPDVDLVMSEAAMLAGAPLDDGSEWEGMPGFENRDMQSQFRTFIHFKTAEDRDAFFKLIDRPVKARWWWPEDDGHKGADWSGQYVTADTAEAAGTAEPAET